LVEKICNILEHNIVSIVTVASPNMVFFAILIKQVFILYFPNIAGDPPFLTAV
jgi:hypothetical protein